MTTGDLKGGCCPVNGGLKVVQPLTAHANCHSDCPLWKNKQVGDTSIVEKRSCKCGSTEHLRTSHRDCPLNKCK